MLNHNLQEFHLRSKKTHPAMLAMLAMLVVWSPVAAAQDIVNNSVEVGHVRWGRDFDGALARSKETGKPVFLLFQEVPGCIGCQEFGKDVLTYPLLVEAIEDEFIPVLVFNNRSSGQDASLLKRYHEPSWNYQVVRFIDGSGMDIIPRQDRIWTIGGIAARMMQALNAARRPVPLYLMVVALEHDTSNQGTVAFAMSCFWTGEYKLGKLEGVISTEAGWYDKREVTLLRYHTSLTDLDRLARQASQERCAQAVYVEPGAFLDRKRFPVKVLDLQAYRTGSKSDQKKQINDWLEKQQDLYLTPMQMTKLNSLIVDDKQEAISWLSPRQREKLK